MAHSEKSYLIIGAGGGVGADLAVRLVSGGARCVLAGRRSEHIYRLGEALQMPVAELDARHEPAVEACYDYALNHLGVLDGVANCVGSLHLKPAHATSADEWNDTIATNLSSAFWTLRGFARRVRGPGSLVFCSSVAAKVGMRNHDAISAAKAGIIGLVKSAAASYGHRQLRVNCVAPGLTLTPLTESVVKNPAVLDNWNAMSALGRAGKASDVSALIAWLLGAESSWITGQVIGVDGGGSECLSNRARTV